MTAPNGTQISASVGQMSFPVGNESTAYSIDLTAQGITFTVDIVLFRVGTVAGDLFYADLGTPDPAQLQGYATTAVNRFEAKTATTKTPPTTTSTLG